MLKLENSNRLQEELNFFESQIQKIKIESNKTRAKKLLQKLKEQIHLINEGHAPYNDGNVDPHTLRENIFELINIRRSLNTLLKNL